MNIWLNDVDVDCFAWVIILNEKDCSIMIQLKMSCYERRDSSKGLKFEKLITDSQIQPYLCMQRDQLASLG